MNKTNLDVTKFDDRSYFLEHCEEILVYKIDNKIELTNNEMFYFLEYEINKYREYGDKGKKDRLVYSICYLCNRYFELDWCEGLGKYQENCFYEQPYEVEKNEYEKTITVTEWKAVK